MLDELGFLAFDNRNADLIFQVVSRRYETKSLVLTTSLAFADWHTIFPSATCATALVERVVHHADIVQIEGETYRLRESQVDATARGRSGATRSRIPKPEPAALNAVRHVAVPGCSVSRASWCSATVILIKMPCVTLADSPRHLPSQRSR